VSKLQIPFSKCWIRDELFKLLFGICIDDNKENGCPVWAAFECSFQMNAKTILLKLPRRDE
jgi:hypothetical protein